MAWQEVRVLLVEDNPDDAVHVSDMVRPSGMIHLDRVETLAQAVERLRRVVYDAALLDLRLPDADGLAALETLHRVAPSLPIVVHSGLVDEDLAMRAMRKGAQDFLLKRYVDEEMFVRAIYYAIERGLRNKARHRIRDEVTDLPSRALFEHSLHRALLRSVRNRCALALLHFAVDSTDESDAALRAAEEMMHQLAWRLTSSLRSSDVVARTGAREFMILVEVTRPGHAGVVAEKIMAAANRPLRVAGREVVPVVHLGVALSPGDGESVDALVQSAGRALEAARSVGVGYRFHSPELNARLVDHKALANALRMGLSRREFELHYQPLVDVSSGRFVALEALLRWRHPGGEMPPELFLPVAEETGLGERIGEWVLQQACVQSRDWTKEAHRTVGVSVNLSASQLFAEGLAETVLRVLRDTGLDPGRLELEVKEYDLTRNAGRALATLSRLHELGVVVSLDDVSGRFVPVPRLGSMPIEGVKLDRSLLRRVASDPNAAAVVRGMVSLAHGCNLRVTAKGVETAEQLDLVRDSACDRMQGYLVSPPQPVSAVPPLFASQPSRPVPV